MKYLGLIGLLLIGKGLLAQVSDSTAIVLEEVEVTTGIFETDPSKIAGSISVLRPMAIERTDGIHLAPAINAIPGVYMQSGALNTNRLTIRGSGARSPFSTNRIKAYLGEIPLSTGEGETTIEDIDFRTLAGMEVYRGPSSTVFGAGLGGTVHLTPNYFSQTNRLEINGLVGSFGLSKYQLLSSVSGASFGATLSYQKVHSDGYRDNNEYDRKNLTLTAGQRIGEDHEMNYFVNYTHLVAQIPSSLSEEDYLNDPEKAAFTWGNAEGFEDNKRLRLGVGYKGDLSDTYQIKASVFMNSGNSREVTPIGSIGIEEVEALNVGWRLQVRADYNKVKLAVGAESFFENFDVANYQNQSSENGALFRSLDQNRNYSNIYVTSTYRPFENWLIEGGINANFSHYKISDDLKSPIDLSARYTFDPVYSPRLSVTRNFGLTALYAMVAHGFSLPSVEETLMPDGQLNPSIKPEVGFSYEVGVKSTMLDGRLNGELSAYLMNADNILVLQRDANDNEVEVNAGESKNIGLELMLTHLVVDQKQFSLRHQLMYTRMSQEFQNFVDDGNDYTGNDVTGVPSYLLDYQVTVSMFKDFFGSAILRSVGQMPMRDDNSVYTDAYMILNLKAGYHKSFGNFECQLYAGVNNTLDEKYASMIQVNAGSFGGNSPRYYYPGLPINYYSGLSVNWRF